ncbi:MAG TPA: hypothetical protein VH415_00020 [Nitrososphaeraceae archaeon]
MRKVLITNLEFTEIITGDENVTFFQSQNKDPVMVRRYREGLDLLQIEVMCEIISFPFDQFIAYCESHS